MDISLLTYIISYLITLSGFCLGKATKSEHIEIKHISLFFAKAFMFVIYGALLILSFETPFFIFSILALILFFIEEFKLKELKEFNYVIVFALSYFVFFKAQYFELFPLILFSMILSHSFKEFSIKETIYSIVLLLILYSIGLFFLN